MKNIIFILSMLSLMNHLTIGSEVEQSRRLDCFCRDQQQLMAQQSFVEVKKNFKNWIKRWTESTNRLLGDQDIKGKQYFVKKLDLKEKKYDYKKSHDFLINFKSLNQFIECQNQEVNIGQLKDYLQQVMHQFRLMPQFFHQLVQKMDQEQIGLIFGKSLFSTSHYFLQLSQEVIGEDRSGVKQLTERERVLDNLQFLKEILSEEKDSIWKIIEMKNAQFQKVALLRLQYMYNYLLLLSSYLMNEIESLSQLILGTFENSKNSYSLPEKMRLFASSNCLDEQNKSKCIAQIVCQNQQVNQFCQKEVFSTTQLSSKCIQEINKTRQINPKKAFNFKIQAFFKSDKNCEKQKFENFQDFNKNFCDSEFLLKSSQILKSELLDCLSGKIKKSLSEDLMNLLTDNKILFQKLKIYIDEYQGKITTQNQLCNLKFQPFSYQVKWDIGKVNNGQLQPIHDKNLFNKSYEVLFTLSQKTQETRLSQFSYYLHTMIKSEGEKLRENFGYLIDSDKNQYSCGKVLENLEQGFILSQQKIQNYLGKLYSKVEFEEIQKCQKFEEFQKLKKSRKLKGNEFQENNENLNQLRNSNQEFAVKVLDENSEEFYPQTLNKEDSDEDFDDQSDDDFDDKKPLQKEKPIKKQISLDNQVLDDNGHEINIVLNLNGFKNDSTDSNCEKTDKKIKIDEDDELQENLRKVLKNNHNQDDLLIDKINNGSMIKESDLLHKDNNFGDKNDEIIQNQFEKISDDLDEESNDLNESQRGQQKNNLKKSKDFNEKLVDESENNQKKSNNLQNNKKDHLENNLNTPNVVKENMKNQQIQGKSNFNQGDQNLDSDDEVFYDDIDEQEIDQTVDKNELGVDKKVQKKDEYEQLQMDEQLAEPLNYIDQEQFQTGQQSANIAYQQSQQEMDQTQILKQLNSQSQFQQQNNSQNYQQKITQDPNNYEDEIGTSISQSNLQNPQFNDNNQKTNQIPKVKGISQNFQNLNPQKNQDLKDNESISLCEDCSDNPLKLKKTKGINSSEEIDDDLLTDEKRNIKFVKYDFDCETFNKARLFKINQEQKAQLRVDTNQDLQAFQFQCLINDEDQKFQKYYSNMKRQVIFESMGTFRLDDSLALKAKFFIFMNNRKDIDEEELVFDPTKTKYCYELENTFQLNSQLMTECFEYPGHKFKMNLSHEENLLILYKKPLEHIERILTSILICVNYKIHPLDFYSLYFKDLFQGDDLQINFSQKMFNDNGFNGFFTIEKYPHVQFRIVIFENQQDRYTIQIRTGFTQLEFSHEKYFYMPDIYAIENIKTDPDTINSRKGEVMKKNISRTFIMWLNSVLFMELDDDLNPFKIKSDSIVQYYHTELVSYPLIVGNFMGHLLNEKFEYIFDTRQQNLTKQYLFDYFQVPTQFFYVTNEDQIDEIQDQLDLFKIKEKPKISIKTLVYKNFNNPSPNDQLKSLKGEEMIKELVDSTTEYLNNQYQKQFHYPFYLLLGIKKIEGEDGEVDIFRKLLVSFYYIEEGDVPYILIKFKCQFFENQFILPYTPLIYMSKNALQIVQQIKNTMSQFVEKYTDQDLEVSSFVLNPLIIADLLEKLLLNSDNYLPLCKEIINPSKGVFEPQTCYQNQCGYIKNKQGKIDQVMNCEKIVYKLDLDDYNDPYEAKAVKPVSLCPLNTGKFPRQLAITISNIEHEGEQAIDIQFIEHKKNIELNEEAQFQADEESLYSWDKLLLIKKQRQKNVLISNFIINKMSQVDQRPMLTSHLKKMLYHFKNHFFEDSANEQETAESQNQSNKEKSSQTNQAQKEKKLEEKESEKQPKK